MKLFYSTATSSTVTHILLREAGIPFNGVEVSWSRNLNVEELNKANRLGTVPALITDDGKLLTQNTAIIEYIADLKPNSSLLPKAGTFERATAISWIAFAASDLQRAFGPVLGAKRLTTNEVAQNELREGGIAKIKTFLEHVEFHLTGKDYILGKEFSGADIPLFVFIGWTKWAEIKTAPYKNISAFMKRIYNRPAVKSVLEAEELDFSQD